MQVFLDVVAASVDIMSICSGVLLAIDRYLCGVFFSLNSNLQSLRQAVCMMFGIYKLFLCELFVSITLLNCLTD